MVAWKHVTALQPLADLHLVTHVRNRENILAAGYPPKKVTFIDVSSPPWAERLYRMLGPAAQTGIATNALMLPQYFAFEQGVAERFGDALRRKDFDLVHRITPVSPGMPSSLGQVCADAGVPFLIGPINGGVPWPRGFAREKHREGGLLSYARPLARLVPGYEATRQYASAIIVGSAAAWRDMPARHHHKCLYLPENAIDREQFKGRTRAYGARPLRGVFTGRFVPCKGLDSLVEAAAPLVRDGRLELELVGDGPERPRLERLIAEAGVSAGIRLPGFVPHEHLAERLCESALFVFPSVREFGGASVMEAMLLGLVPVVADWGGPSEVVTDETGFRVPLPDRRAFVRNLRATLERVCALPPATLEAMGEAASARIASEFVLEHKAAVTRDIYAWLVEGAPRPALAPPARAIALYKGR
jgi:glycosyltransferase involved in cell wall biosynthesis